MFLLGFLFYSISFAAENILWEIKDGLKNPESVYYDETTSSIFVSNISGEGVVKDGSGWIQKLTTEGKNENAKWIKGLNAPKGMRAHKGVLWVSDIDRLVSIDIASGKILKQIHFPQAKFLNDIAITPDNIVFVSDTIGRRIYKVENNKFEVFLEGDVTESPNGLLIQDNKLIVAAWGLAEPDWSAKVPGNLYSVDLKTKAKKLITKKPLGNLDGLEISSDGSYLVSDWMVGLVYKVEPNGKVHQLSLKSEQGIADIGYIPSTETLLVPHMNSSQVIAYDLKKTKSSSLK